MDTLYYIILVPMVYLAFAVFLLGSLWRILGLARRPFPRTAPIFPPPASPLLAALADSFLMPTARRHTPVLWVFLMVFHLCFLLLIVGHLELFHDFAIFQVIPHEIFLGSGVVGVLLTLCLLFFLFRRFVPPAKDMSVAEDYLLLILLFVTVLFGAEMDWARRWYGYEFIGVPEYRAYLLSLVTLQPSADAVLGVGHTFMLVVHVFFANLFLMFVPFSKIMHAFFAIPINKLRRG